MRPKNLEKEEAIRTIALQLIAEEGLENLTMQKLAKVANVSPRTIYLKYENKDDLLIKLFIDDVLGAYETAVLANFDETADFAPGLKRIWLNTFHYFRNNRPYFTLMQYGKYSPLLNKAFLEKDIKEGQFFGPVNRFLRRNALEGVINDFPHDVYRALLFSPVHELIKEYFDHEERPQQIITEKLILDCCEVVIKGMLK